tara:strand:- start:13 stop:375 length:363 start_codon:yes stop_codon:yes gene_type:complete
MEAGEFPKIPSLNMFYSFHGESGEDELRKVFFRDLPGPVLNTPATGSSGHRRVARRGQAVAIRIPDRVSGLARTCHRRRAASGKGLSLSTSFPALSKLAVRASERRYEVGGRRLSGPAVD